MKQETQELTNLPLSFLISAPLNAAIEAQRASALSTAAFIEQVGFIPTKADGSKEETLTLFANEENDNNYEVRQAVVRYTQDEVVLKTAAVPGDPGVTPPIPPTPAVFEVKQGAEKTLQLPFISLLTIPVFEVSELTIDFGVRLLGITQFEAEFNNEASSSVRGEASAKGDLNSLGIPLSVGGSMRVQASTSSQFGLRYGQGHEAEYNLNVSVKAVQASPPKGIERLLALAEKIVDASERANAEKDNLNAAPAPVTPVTPVTPAAAGG